MGKKIPPDGGWGWIIVMAYAMNCITTIPIMQGFGLIFKDLFPLLKLSATDGSIIINVNMAFGMILGLVNGPLLRSYGYRKIAVAGSFIYSIGVISSAFADNFSALIITYGILASSGMGLMMSSISLAINTYFTTKRSRAMGLAMTITGLGPIVMPQVTSFLISYYGLKGTIIIFAAIGFHSLISTCLLQPVKRHLKELPDPVECEKEQIEKQLERDVQNEFYEILEDKKSLHESLMDITTKQRKRTTTISSIDHDVEVGSIYGFDTPLPFELSETLHYRSMDTINLGSSMKIFDESNIYIAIPKNKNLTESMQNFNEENTLNDENNDVEYRKKSRVKKALLRVVKFYDLTLLRDPIYVNLMMGMSIAIFAEINFSLLTPFILADMKLTTKQIALVMSLTASADLLSRGASPFIGERLGWPPRTMYLSSLLLLIISRSTLMFTSGLYSILIVAVGLGMAKGIRSVYMSLVIPSYVPLERLPYASGIQMVVNGFILLLAGPILGFIRDITGSYIPCIALINAVTAVTVIMWLTEMVITKNGWRGNKSKTNINGRKY